MKLIINKIKIVHIVLLIEIRAWESIINYQCTNKITKNYVTKIQIHIQIALSVSWIYRSQSKTLRDSGLKLGCNKSVSVLHCIIYIFINLAF